MNAHGVHVLHVADGDAGVIRVPHHLVFQLNPATQALFQQYLADPGPLQSHFADAEQILACLGYASP